MAGIDFQKQLTETVYINLPGPSAPAPGMMGGELMHGFMAALYNAPTKEMKAWITGLCMEWNIVYRQKPG
jgi:hypothetical protein